MKRNLTWIENEQAQTRNWVTASDLSQPKKVLIADDGLRASDFHRQASEGAAFIYKGDFQNAKQLLQAVQRRIDKSEKAQTFHQHRQAQAQRARVLSRLLICVEADYSINLRRAPDVCLAISEAVESGTGAFVLSLRELLSYISAHEWRKKGVFIKALNAKIHPHYGIFSPVRGEYLDLVNQTQLPASINRAFDIGTGTGVIAAILAKRGIKKIIATDLNPRALSCASENITRLGYAEQVTLVETDLFPPGTADLIVCNPPWIPARPTSCVEYAVYDENSQMLKGFLGGLHKHLTEDGEAWLILSDLAEHLKLREPQEVQDLITTSKLKILECHKTKPKHPKSLDKADPLHQARSKETTLLFRLKKA